MSFTTDFIHFVRTDTELGFGTAVSNRIHPSTYTGTAYPACVYNERGGDYDQYGYAGSKTFKATRMQLDVYAPSNAIGYTVLSDLKTRVVDRLGKYSGPMGAAGATSVKTTQILDIRIMATGEADLSRLLIDIELQH